MVCVIDYRALKLDGLIVEQLPAGKFRLRVRVKGAANRRLLIPNGLPKYDFMEAYAAARDGIPCTYRPTTLHLLQNKGTYIRV